MRFFAIAILMLAVTYDGPPEDAATTAYHTQNYLQAARLYEQAIAELPRQEAELRFNMAQCYFAVDSTTEALEQYDKVLPRLPAVARSVAYNNIGITQARRGQLKLALETLRQALITDPDNERARYNYELILRHIENQPPPPPPDSLPPPPPIPPQNPPTPQETADAQTIDPQNLQEVIALLEQLKAREKQFYQELRRAGKVRRRYQEGPDW